MKFPYHLTRTLLTFFGFAAFLILALGSDNPKRSQSRLDYQPTYSPSPEVVGREDALAWAKSTSADLTNKIRQVEMRRNNAQCEVRELEKLKRQFPDYADKTEERIEEWNLVVIELNSALTAVTESTSAAYHAHLAEGKDSSTVLGEAYSQWSPKADRAIAFAKKQRTKSSACR